MRAGWVKCFVPYCKMHLFTSVLTYFDRQQNHLEVKVLQIREDWGRHSRFSFEKEGVGSQYYRANCGCENWGDSTFF